MRHLPTARMTTGERPPHRCNKGKAHVKQERPSPPNCHDSDDDRIQEPPPPPPFDWTRVHYPSSSSQVLGNPWENPIPQRVPPPPFSQGYDGAIPPAAFLGEPWRPPVPPATNDAETVTGFIVDFENNVRDWCMKMEDKMDKLERLMGHMVKELVILQSVVRELVMQPPPGFGQQEEVPPVKKGPGRPRKVVLGLVSPSGASTSGSQRSNPKRGR